MKKIKYLEGLRGIAAFAVLLGHLGIFFFIPFYEIRLFAVINNAFFLPYFIKAIIIHIVILFTNGELAVWIFWLLSSYVLSIAFFKAGRPHKNALLVYPLKRYIRLLIPVFFSIFFAYLLLSFGLMYHQKVALSFNPPNLTINSLYNFKPDLLEVIWSAFFTTFFNYTRATSYNTVLWTIQAEFLGSIFIFAMFRIIGKNAKRFIIYSLIAIILVIINMLPLLAFVIGYALCDYDFSTTGNTIIFSLKKMEIFIQQYKLLFFASTVLLILFGRGIMNFMKISPDMGLLIVGAFVLYCCLRNEYYQKILSAKLPYWLGEISFSLYLIHVPIFCSFACFIVFHYNSLEGKIVASVSSILLTLLLSIFYARYIDKKAVAISHKIGNYFKKES
ncbi:MAG TPA: acyltransferase [Ferruginibacter sp.]|nr:acyltransferase [Ferruginibacter sp.]